MHSIVVETICLNDILKDWGSGNRASFFFANIKLLLIFKKGVLNGDLEAIKKFP